MMQVFFAFFSTVCAIVWFCMYDIFPFKELFIHLICSNMRATCSVLFLAPRMCRFESTKVLL